MQTLIVRLLKTHFLHRSLILNSQQNRIELVTRPLCSFSHDVPVCAAVSCLRDVHYGSVIEELATLFYLLPEPIVRSTYMVFMLQNYCHVLTLTLEMLNIEWEDKFR